ncbi:unnamed protein product [Somion occarium]|uniref:Hydrophobin n=1 Tax=Somion occarium TaxID=3059160 RepID=A0ABP1D6W5_9APHY
MKLTHSSLLLAFITSPIAVLSLNPIIGISQCKTGILCCQAMGATTPGSPISQIVPIGPQGPPLVGVACTPFGTLTAANACEGIVACCPSGVVLPTNPGSIVGPITGLTGCDIVDIMKP